MSHLYVKKINFAAGGISLTYMRNNHGPKIELCGTPHDVFP